MEETLYIVSATAINIVTRCTVQFITGIPVSREPTFTTPLEANEHNQ